MTLPEWSLEPLEWESVQVKGKRIHIRNILWKKNILWDYIKIIIYWVPSKKLRTLNQVHSEIDHRTDFFIYEYFIEATGPDNLKEFLFLKFFF